LKRTPQPPKKNPNTVIGVWVPPALRRRLEKLAKEEGRSLSSFVARALEQFVRKAA
jgi:predicted transcriptional regulator